MLGRVYLQDLKHLKSTLTVSRDSRDRITEEVEAREGPDREAGSARESAACAARRAGVEPYFRRLR